MSFCMRLAFFLRLSGEEKVIVVPCSPYQRRGKNMAACPRKTAEYIEKNNCCALLALTQERNTNERAGLLALEWLGARETAAGGKAGGLFLWGGAVKKRSLLCPARPNKGEEY